MRTRLLAAALLAVTPFMAGAPAHATGHVATGHVTAVSSAQATLMASNTPKTVILDAATGAVVSVTTTSTTISPASVDNICHSGDLCWTHYTTPYADYGFSGVGTYNGNWIQRHWATTNNHSASICWDYAGHSPCSPRVGAHTIIGMSAYPVTGWKVSLFT